MKLLVLTGLMTFTLSAFAIDCVPRYQRRIDRSQEWARLNNLFPKSGRKRARKAQEVINLINQSQNAMGARFPGGRELVRLTYDVNRFRLYDDRATVREVAGAILSLQDDRSMCPDLRNLMSMREIRRAVSKRLFP